MTTISTFATPADAHILTGTSPPVSNPLALRPLRIGLIGLGTVGRGFHELITRRGAELGRDHGLAAAVDRVLVREGGKHRGDLAPRTTTSQGAFLAGRYDVVVEASGAVDEVVPVVRALLSRGTPVVTANKALVAQHGRELSRLAHSATTSFRFDASVSPGIPLFQILERSLRTTKFRRITAILNGTSNFVLTRLASGESHSVAAAVEDARRLGFSESDPEDDLSGVDAARKLAILARVVLDVELPVSRIEVLGIGGVRPDDCARAAAAGGRLKPVACAELEAGSVRAFVGPRPIPNDHPLATVEREMNGIHLSSDDDSAFFAAGLGAGARPTAAALFDDVLCAIETRAREGRPS